MNEMRVGNSDGIILIGVRPTAVLRRVKKTVAVSLPPLKVRQGLTWNHTNSSKVTGRRRTAGATAGPRFELNRQLHRVPNYFRLLWQQWRNFGLH